MTITPHCSGKTFDYSVSNLQESFIVYSLDFHFVDHLLLLRVDYFMNNNLNILSHPKVEIFKEIKQILELDHYFTYETITLGQATDLMMRTMMMMVLVNMIGHVMGHLSWMVILFFICVKDCQFTYYQLYIRFNIFRVIK